jgi:rRNA biogenesis protein RRP5
MVEGKDSGEWVKKIVIGSVVLGKVVRILPVGFEVSLASKVTGLVLGQEKVVEMGQQISCKVIDIDISSRIVDLKIVEEGEMELDVSREAVDQVITSQTTVEGVIENTKEAYSIIKVPSLGNLIAFCASRSLNSFLNAPPRYKTGQKVNVTLVKSVDSDVTRVFACFVVKDGAKNVKNGDSRRLIKNPVDPSLSSLDDILFGKMVKAKIQSVKDMQLNIRLGDNLRGRVHLTQIYDSFNDIPNQVKPLESFKNGDEIVCKVMGFHSLKTHKFLPITHTNPTSQIGVELSIKPSFLGNASMTEESISQINLGPGSFHIGFIQNIEQDCLWVQVGPTTLGRVDCLSISDKVEVLETISKNFKIGQAVTCSVLSFDSEKGRLDLSMVFDRELTLLKKVCVKITQINPAVGLSVSLGSQKYGRIEVSELYDTCRENPSEAFKIGQILKASIVGIQGSRIDLSLREKIMEVKDLENGCIVEGYVRSISDKGCFVSLFYNSTGRVKISEMSDLYIKDWKSIYKVGQLVKGKIINLDLNKNQIELSLKESMIDPKMKLLDFSDLKLKSVMSGTVKKIEAFGLFIQLDQTNIRGLCHISEV